MYGYSSLRTYPSQTVVALPDFKKGPGPQFGEVLVVAVIQRAWKERLLRRSRAYVGIYDVRGAPRYDGFARLRNFWADQNYGLRPVVARFELSDPPVV